MLNISITKWTYYKCPRVGPDQRRGDLSIAGGIADEENERGIRINNQKVVRYLSGEKAGLGSFYKTVTLTNPLKTVKAR